MKRELSSRIPISQEIKKQLRELGGKGETYDQIIEKLIQKYENC